MISKSRYDDMKDGYCENCPNPADCYQTGRCWPVVDYVPDAGELCAEMDEAYASHAADGLDSQNDLGVPPLGRSGTQKPE